MSVLPGAAGAASPSDSSATKPRIHEVRSGDTLGRIARRYSTTVEALVAANQLPGRKAILRTGQRLVVPAPPPRVAAAARSVPPPRRLREPGGGTPTGLMLAVPDFDGAAPLFAWPVEGAVSSTFGRRRMGWHRGIDIMAEPGSPVRAAASGVVVASGVEPRYGLVVKIQHADGFMTVYAHNEENQVNLGDEVPAGAVVATVGRTGRATAPHLHFEIRRDTRVYNPLYLLPLPPRVVQVEEGREPHDDD
jgi:murein DD-endopeptidase MepM/ murein hydrolase activator NlpD